MNTWLRKMSSTWCWTRCRRHPAIGKVRKDSRKTNDRSFEGFALITTSVDCVHRDCLGTRPCAAHAILTSEFPSWDYNDSKHNECSELLKWDHNLYHEVGNDTNKLYVYHEFRNIEKKWQAGLCVMRIGKLQVSTEWKTMRLLSIFRVGKTIHAINVVITISAKVVINTTCWEESLCVHWRSWQ